MNAPRLFHTRLRVKIILGLSAIALLVGRAAPMATGAGLEPVVYFKQFMSTPPVVNSLLYRKTMASDLNVGFHDDVDISVNYGFVRWEEHYSYLRLGTNKDLSFGAKRFGEEVHARLLDDFWSVDGAGLITHWKDSAIKLKATRIRPSRTFQSRFADFRQIMNMGLMNLDIGAVKWEGDRFRAEGYVIDLPGPVHVEGALKVSESGYPRQMEVIYTLPKTVCKYTIRYSYFTNAGASLLPDSFDCSLVNESKEIHLAAFKILELTLSTTNMPPVVFAPSELNHSSLKPLYYHNGGWYMTNSIGKLAPIGKSMIRNTIHSYRERYDLNKVYYGAVLLTTATAFYTLCRRTNKQQTTEQNK